MSENVSILAIGDPHFKKDYLAMGTKYILKVLEVVENIQPTFVVLLGDILDKHDIAYNEPFLQANDLIGMISKLCPIYVIIGNHDYINNSQFLSEKHFFYPYKYANNPNICIVDKVKYLKIHDREFVFCPYTPVGRFEEALNTLVKENDVMWSIVDGIFAHQEFRNCDFGATKSEKGDLWDEGYPPVFSGHIHGSQIIGSNVYYTGSSIQHGFSKNLSKYSGIWHIVYGETLKKYHDEEEFCYKKISLDLPKKRIITTTTTEFQEIYHKNKDTNDKIKYKVYGTTSELRSFRDSKVKNNIKNSNHIIQEINTEKNVQQRNKIKKIIKNSSLEKKEGEKSNNGNLYPEIFEALVKSKEDKVLLDIYQNDLIEGLR